MQDIISEKLISIARYAYETVPFYRRLGEEFGIDVSRLDNSGFECLPLIEKPMILGKESELLSDSYVDYSHSKNLIIRRTSGSSGHYLKVYWDMHDDIRSLIGLWYRRENLYGISPGDKYCYFYTTEYYRNKFVPPKDAEVSIDNRAIGFCKSNMNFQRIREIYKRMVEFNPKWLVMQPSVALLFSRVIAENGLPKIKDLAYIELTGEYLTDSVRNEIESAFQCMVSNQYGCNETNSIASECRNRKLHIHSASIYVEIIKDGKKVPYGDVGDIYLTSLENKAMPFIRYRIGDQGILHEAGSCGCGCRDMVLELKSGRECEMVTVSEQEEISSYIFLRAIEYINEKVGNIVRQFQIVQHDIGVFTVKMAVKASYFGWKDTIKDLFVQELSENSLCNAKWKFEFSTDLFPDDKTGKLAFFINDYKRKK